MTGTNFGMGVSLRGSLRSSEYVLAHDNNRNRVARRQGIVKKKALDWTGRTEVYKADEADKAVDVAKDRQIKRIR